MRKTSFPGVEQPLRWLTDEEIAALSNGRVRKPETLNYRTMTPEKEGLFCKEIFGADASKPGNTQRSFGHVELPIEVVHPWFLTRDIASLCRVSGKKEEELRRLCDYELFIDPESLEILPEAQLQSEIEKGNQLEAGAAALRWLIHDDVYFLSSVLVIPGQLRPLIPLEDGRFATSDLNDLYRRLINRSNRLRRLMELDAPHIILRNEARMTQESVSALFDNNQRTKVITGPNNRALVSLLDMVEKSTQSGALTPDGRIYLNAVGLELAATHERKAPLEPGGPSMVPTPEIEIE